ncbi:MAG TPA: SAM-dependent methyltransferase [Opitutaceae bacterium]|nr:SAM-dependent methyltransferase [Opitutaceae bacterium]
MSETKPSARDRFLTLVRAALHEGALVKLTLGKYRGDDATLRNLFIRPVALKTGPHFAFVWRHATRDVTKNFPATDALDQIEPLLGRAFLDAHLFTNTQSAQLECQPDGAGRLKVSAKPATAEANRADLAERSPASGAHDRAKHRVIPAEAPWLRALGVTNDRGQPREGMADKFRQIQKFAELFSHLLAEADFPGDRPLRVADMGAGKGYLTFAIAALLGERGIVHGIVARAVLVALCSRIAREQGFAHLTFSAGQIASAPIENALDVLIALHACDTATDDALARGVSADARLLIVAPCCQKELRPQLAAPPVLADALRHGIFQERQAEFVTDALRAQLLEWCGYRTKVFEFVSTEHTAKNLMIAAIRARPRGRMDDAFAASVRAFAQFYGIRSHALARQLGFSLTPGEAKQD